MAHNLEGSFFFTGARFFHLLSMFYSLRVLIYFYVFKKLKKKKTFVASTKCGGGLSFLFGIRRVKFNTYGVWEGWLLAMTAAWSCGLNSGHAPVDGVTLSDGPDSLFLMYL